MVSPKRPRERQDESWRKSFRLNPSTYISAGAVFLFVIACLWQVTYGRTLQSLLAVPTTSQSPVELHSSPGTPIPCQSHNDYWRRRPLYDALEAGCTGVEADVWLFGEELYVGHDTRSLRPDRTLRSLYIDPLVEILQHREGVFDDASQSLVLLIDLKTNGTKTWQRVVDQLKPLRDRDLLTYTEGDNVVARPLTVVATGNAPFDQVLRTPGAFFDAPLDALDGTYNRTNSEYASVSFTASVGHIWRVFSHGTGLLSHSQLHILRDHVRSAHERGLRVRYWDQPSWPSFLRNKVWDLLRAEGVDTLNVDDLTAARDFLTRTTI